MLDKKKKNNAHWSLLGAPLVVLSCLLGSLQSCGEKEPDPFCGDGFEDSRDAAVYCSTTIGTQEWLSENIRYEQAGGFENPNASNEGTKKYGRLYTYEAALKACPVGWHLPTDAEWKTLEQSLGMSAAEVDQVNLRGSDQGQQLKDEAAWDDETNANTYDFTALPTGEYNPSYGPYFKLGEQASFWTATRSDTSGGVWVRVLKRGEQGIRRTYYSELSGHACRCVAD